MRIPERAHWAALRLCTSLSQAASRGRCPPPHGLANPRALASINPQHCAPIEPLPVQHGSLSPSHCRVVAEHWSLLPHSLLPGTSNTQRRFISFAALGIRFEAPAAHNLCTSLRYEYSTLYSTLQERGRGDHGGDAPGEGKTSGVSETERRSDSTAELRGEDGFEDETGAAPAVGRAAGGGVGGSGSGWSREEVINWPNAISIARLLSGPCIAWMILQGFAKPALIGLVLAGASDWLDGYVARRMGINSVLGSYLDPLADKVLIGCIAVSMAYAGLLHPALVALIVARDGVLLAGSFVYRAYTLRWQWSGWEEFFKIGAGGVEKVKPIFISKVNMVLQLALIGTALVQPALELQDTYSLIPILSWSVVATTTASWIGYAWLHLWRPNPAVLVGGVQPLPSRRASSRAAKEGMRKVESSDCS